MYRTYFMKVYSYVMNIVKNSSEAEEITQNTFIKAMTTKASYRGKSGEYTWLCAIAKNLCNDFFRSKGRTAELSEIGENLADYSCIEDDFVARESSFVIHKILHDLEEPYKEVFELRVFGELSFAEIAEIFSKTESWARVSFHRARLKIKERLD